MEGLILVITSKLAAIMGLQQMLEYLILRPQLNSSGLWNVEILVDDCENPVLKKLYRGLYSPLSFQFFLSVGIASAIGLFFYAVMAIPLLAASVYMSNRFRGNFNGGSDSMSALVLVSLGLSVALSPILMKAAFIYLGIQCSLSYFMAGIVKIKNPDWRSGKTLQEIIRYGNYEVPSSIQDLLKSPSIAKRLSWITILFECSFPLCFFSAQLTLIYMALGFAFHLANSYALGLNRFTWAWLASYPALFYTGVVLRISL